VNQKQEEDGTDKLKRKGSKKDLDKPLPKAEEPVDDASPKGKRRPSKGVKGKDTAEESNLVPPDNPAPTVARDVTVPVSSQASTRDTPCTPIAPVDESAQVFLRMLPYQRMPYDWADDRLPRSFIHKGRLFEVPPLPLYELDPDVPKPPNNKQHKGWQKVKSKVMGGGLPMAADAS
jgi:hypothetical protein